MRLDPKKVWASLVYTYADGSDVAIHLTQTEQVSSNKQCFSFK